MLVKLAAGSKSYSICIPTQPSLGNSAEDPILLPGASFSGPDLRHTKAHQSECGALSSLSLSTEEVRSGDGGGTLPLGWRWPEIQTRAYTWILLLLQLHCFHLMLLPRKPWCRLLMENCCCLPVPDFDSILRLMISDCKQK